MTTPPAIVCAGITKVYHADGVDTPALRGVDLTVERGELFMLAGPSGCGKTTLISIIAGILNHDGGRCDVLGEDIAKLSDAERTAFRGNNIGFVFQSYNLIPTITARENVAVPLLINGVPRHDALARADHALTLVAMEEKRMRYPRELSGGQQQRVAIARSLVHEPKIVVCDEPTAALDGDTGHKVMELFRAAALQAGRTLVIVTHDSRIFSFADRIATMNDGAVVSIAAGATHTEKN